MVDRGGDAAQSHVVQKVLANLAQRDRPQSVAQQLLLGGPQEEPEHEIKPTSVVVYGSTGRKLNFDPEELQEPPAAFEGDEKKIKEWGKLVPVYLGKATADTHFQMMTLEQLRRVMETAVLNKIAKQQEEKKKRNAKRSRQRNEANATECIMLRNLVGRGELDDALYDEVTSEMCKYGTITSLTAFESEDPSIPDEESVRIFIRFSSVEEAKHAHSCLHLRVFGGRYVACSFFPVSRFIERDLAPRQGAPGEYKLPPKCLERYDAAAAEKLAIAKQKLEEEQKKKKKTQQGQGPVEVKPAELVKKADQVVQQKAAPKLLPPHVEALVEVLRAAAEGKEVSQEMIFKADPIAEMEHKDNAERLEAMHREASEEAAELQRRNNAIEAVAMLNLELEASAAAAAAAAPPEAPQPTVTADVEGID